MSALSDWLHACRYLFAQERGLLWLGMGIMRAHAQGALRLAAGAPDSDAVLQRLLIEALAPVARHEAISWSPPDGWQGPVKALDLLPPEKWLGLVQHAFETIPKMSHVRLRLARLRPGGTNDIALLHASEQPVAVSINMPVRTDPVFRRPLRIASIARALPDDSKLPSADVFALAADRANSDLLVHLGPLRALLADVLARPYSCKTNLIVVRQALPAPQDTSSFTGDLHYLAKFVHANAVLLIAPETSDDEVSEALNAFANEEGFDEPFDIVLERVFSSKAILWCSAAFANQRLSGIDASAGRGLAGRKSIATRGTTRSVPSFGARRATSWDKPKSAARVPPPTTESWNGTKAAPPAKPPRFLQQQSFRLENEPVNAKGGFRAHTHCAVDVRIGPADKQWDSLVTAFPDHLLPTMGTSTLTVWLTEPQHIPHGLQGRITIGPVGTSATCRLRFVAGRSGNFDGRLTVMHHGRVLQTARLLAKVMGAHDPTHDDGTPCLREQIGVSHAFTGLDARKNFDVAIVTNHGNQDEPRATIYSGEQAQVTALAAAAEIGKEINYALSAAAKTAADMVGGIESDTGRKLIVKLARKGRILGTKLFPNGFDRRAQAGIARNNRIQIVHTRADGVMPLEFVYDHPSPAEHAGLCPNWKAALEAGDCPGTCALATSDHSAEYVCPMGFWGISKVIERHQLGAKKTPPGVVTLLAEHAPGASKIDLRGDVVVAFSNRVLDDPRKQVQAVLGKFSVLKARVLPSWNDWRAVVSKTNPALIVSLPHAAGSGTEVTLEIEGISLEIADLTRGHVTSDGDRAIAPVVMLIGCDVAQTLAEYGSYIEMFRACGAAVVVATVSTVYGSQAAAAASRLAETLFSDPDGNTTIGEALRDTRRQALLNGEVMPLALVAYGDADWELKTGG